MHECWSRKELGGEINREISFLDFRWISFV